MADQDIENIKGIVDPIEGWLSGHEAELLYHSARRCTGKGVIVEIGSYKGKSAIWLAKGSQRGKNIKIYAIDPHEGYTEYAGAKTPANTFAEFSRNIEKARASNLIVPIVDTSHHAALSFHEPVELLFIDGSHEYSAVKEDFHDWIPKVVDGGMVMFHDTIGYEGPRRVVNELVYLSDQFKNIKLIDEITWAVKSKNITAADRLKNSHMLIIKKLSEGAVHLRIPKAVRQWGKKILKKVQD